VTAEQPYPPSRKTALSILVRVVLPWLVLLAAIVAAAASVASQWSRVWVALETIGLGRVLAATVLGVLGVAVTAEVWRCSVVAATQPVPRMLAYRVFWVSQAGKYVPGAVWPFLVQALAARRMGIAARGVLTGSLVFLGVHALTALFVGSLGVALLPADKTIRISVWTATLIAVLALGSGAWRHVPRLLGRQALPPLQLPVVMRALGWMTLAWLFYGSSTALLLASLTGVGATSSLLQGSAASAVGWLVGLLIVIAPAGAGARELAMAWMLGAGMGAEELLALILLTRLILLVGDLGLALAGVSVLKTLRRADDTGQPGSIAPSDQLPDTSAT
jgi:uncharacterized membrane protein YbhN (UPF0104 family)